MSVQLSPGQWSAESIHEETCENGLEVLMIRRPKTPLVSMRLYISAGSRYDKGEGRAHLTEHCLATGAQVNGTPVELLLEQIGAELEAGTHRDYMHFSVSALPRDLSQGLQALGAIGQSPQITDALVEREQKIIFHELEEYRDGLDTLWDSLFGGLWEAHPFVSPAVGGSEIFHLTKDDLHEHWLEVVRPNRAVLAVVGDIDPTQVLAEVERHFGAWDRGDHDGGQGHSAPVLKKRPGWTRVPADLKHSYFVVGWPVPAAGSEDDATLTMVAQILGGGANAVLPRRLRNQDTDIYSVQAMVKQYGDTGTLAIAGSCAPGRLESVINSVIELVTQSHRALPFGEDDLTRCQRGYRASVARTYETAHMRAALLGLNGLWGVRRTMEDRLSLVSSITMDDMAECNHRHFSSRAPAIAIVG